MKEFIKIFALLTQPAFLYGLKEYFKDDPEIYFNGAVFDEKNYIDGILKIFPDIILIDYPIEKKTAAVEKLLNIRKFKIIALLESDINIKNSLNKGCIGFILKTFSLDEIKYVIQKVWLGEFLNSRLASEILNKKHDSLSDRELEVLNLIASGNSNKQIAYHLKISERTVKNHITNIFKKIDVADRTEAAVFAIKEGIVNL